MKLSSCSSPEHEAAALPPMQNGPWFAAEPWHGAGHPSHLPLHAPGMLSAGKLLGQPAAAASCKLFVVLACALARHHCSELD